MSLPFHDWEPAARHRHEAGDDSAAGHDRPYHDWEPAARHAPFVSSDSFARILHEWEIDPEGPDPAFPFPDGGDGDDECSDLEEDDGPPTPGAQFVEKLVSLYLVNKLSARDCAELAYWASQAGVQEATKYSLAPGDPSDGHYSRKMKSAVGFNDRRDLLPVEIPGHVKRSLGRTKHNMVIMPLHEQIAADMKDNAPARTKLDELVRSHALPPAYWQHPLVADRNEDDDPMIPIAFYLDGVPWSIHDGVVGFWGINLLTSQRYLWGVLKKSKCCQCGCRGWCSYYHFFEAARWSLDALARGKFPTHRYDGAEFHPRDVRRKSLAGGDMGVTAVCLYIKGDWAEYSTTLGLMSCQSNVRPCFECAGCGEDLYVCAGNTVDALRWRLNEVGDYSTHTFADAPSRSLFLRGRRCANF